MTSPAKILAFRRGRSAGFTLIELLVVITILGLALALISGHGPLRSAGLQAKSAAADLAGGLREARARAIAQNRPVDLALDVTAHRWRIDGQLSKSVPPGFVITVLTIKGETRNDSIAAIRFEPDGSSTGGRIGLADGQRKIAIDIDWLTGNVRVSNE
ncbi:MAG: xpsH [Rhodospirillales bacterium]|nr:xpsH [Rhodospirillales bacterium]